MLKGYLPANMERRDLVLKRKRDEYFGFIEQYYHSRTDEHYKDTYRQVICQSINSSSCHIITHNLSFMNRSPQSNVHCIYKLFSWSDSHRHSQNQPSDPAVPAADRARGERSFILP